MNPTAVRSLFSSPLFQAPYVGSDDPVAPAALPDEALTFLREVCLFLGAKKVFEFGSGRSTRTFLEAGCAVTSLEDSERWMGETTQNLPAGFVDRHHASVEPLRVVWRGGVPFRDWKLNTQLKASLGEADLVLVDSPLSTGYRISTLCCALTHAPGAVVILDDARIGALAKFSNRLARQNPSRLLHRRVPVGHTFDCFARVGEGALDRSMSLVESLKAWRRFLLGHKMTPSVSAP